MKKKKMDSMAVKIGGGLLAAMAVPGVVHACACGCGVFSVGGPAMLPTEAGGTAFLQYDYQDQNRNYSGYSQAPASANDDKEVVTDFLTAGLRYMFNNRWGVEAEIPYDYRSFKTVTGNPNVPDGTVATINWWSLGDIRLEGIYTGFFPDMSAGVTFGLKLPTGSYTDNNAYGDVDRDSEIGTGSTDILLGGFDRGNITEDGKWGWFGQLMLDVPTLTQAGYRPGVELDSDAGIDYQGFSLGSVEISPTAQVIFSERTSDSGSNAAGGSNDDPEDGVSSGYQRLMLSPGLKIHIHPVTFYADAEFPVFQHYTGNQLVPPVLFKLSMSYMF
jgi:hypothetical protein